MIPSTLAAIYFMARNLLYFELADVKAYNFQDEARRADTI